MKTLSTRLIGIALIIAAAGGLLFSLIGLFAIWYFRPMVKESVLENLRLGGSALEATYEGLTLADTSLGTSIASMTTLHNTVTATARTIEETSPLVDTLAILTQEDLPATISSAQTSLIAAQESARIIDSVLTALTSIPFVPKDIYNPPVPLHIALQSVSDSMNNLPQALDQMETSLQATSSNLQVIQTDIDLVALDIDNIKISMESAQDVIEQYQTLVLSAQERLERMEETTPTYIDLLAWVFTFILIWAAVAQLGMFVQGIDLVSRRPL